jgi:hypothetical protein
MFNSIRLASDRLIEPAASILTQPYATAIPHQRFHDNADIGADAPAEEPQPATRPVLDR